MMSMARRCFKRRSMNLEMMKMAVWCPRLNKEGEKGVMVRNKSRLVAQGFSQKEGALWVEAGA
jgi:hypothetical protein